MTELKPIHESIVNYIRNNPGARPGVVAAALGIKRAHSVTLFLGTIEKNTDMLFSLDDREGIHIFKESSYV